MRSDASGKVTQLLMVTLDEGRGSPGQWEECCLATRGFMKGGSSCAEGPPPTSSRSNVFPNSKWCLSKMEEPWSLASGFWDLNSKERDTHRESTWNGGDEG